MVSLTFIELHFDGDTQLGSDRLGTIALGESDEEFEGEDEDDSGGKPIGVLVGLVFLVALGLAFRKFRGGDDEVEEFEPADEPDVIVN